MHMADFRAAEASLSMCSCGVSQHLQVSHGSGFILAKLDGKPGWSSPLPFHVTTTGVGVTIGYSEVRLAHTERGNPTNSAELPCTFTRKQVCLLKVQVDTLMVLDSAEAVQEFLKTQVTLGSPHDSELDSCTWRPLGHHEAAKHSCR